MKGITCVAGGRRVEENAEERASLIGSDPRGGDGDERGRNLWKDDVKG